MEKPSLYHPSESLLRDKRPYSEVCAIPQLIARDVDERNVAFEGGVFSVQFFVSVPVPLTEEATSRLAEMFRNTPSYQVSKRIKVNEADLLRSVARKYPARNGDGLPLTIRTLASTPTYWIGEGRIREIDLGDRIEQVTIAQSVDALLAARPVLERHYLSDDSGFLLGQLVKYGLVEHHVPR